MLITNVAERRAGVVPANRVDRKQITPDLTSGEAWGVEADAQSVTAESHVRIGLHLDGDQGFGSGT